MKIIEKQKELQEKAAKEGIALSFQTKTIEIKQNGMTGSASLVIQPPMISIHLSGKMKDKTTIYIWDYLEFLSRKHNAYFFYTKGNWYVRDLLALYWADKACLLEKMIEKNRDMKRILKSEFRSPELNAVVFTEKKEEIKDYLLLSEDIYKSLEQIQKKYPTVVYEMGKRTLSTYDIDVSIQYHGKREVVFVSKREKWELCVGENTYEESELFTLFEQYLQRVEKEMRLQDLYEPDTYHFSSIFNFRTFSKQESMKIHDYLRKTNSNQEIEEKAVQHSKSGKGVIEPFLQNKAANHIRKMTISCYSILGAYVLMIEKSKDDRQLLFGDKQTILDMYQQNILSAIQDICVEGIEIEENKKENVIS